jgi:hypothetical protein
VRRHRVKVVAKKALLAMKEITEQERTQREKEAFKSQMRSKVSTWLSEISKHDDKIISPDKKAYDTLDSKEEGSHFMSGFQEVLGISNYQSQTEKYTNQH